METKAKVKTKVKAEPKYLYTDVESWENAQRSEAEVLGLYDSLRKTAVDVLGETAEIDHVKYLDNPREYLIEEYWKISGRPAHLKKNAEHVMTSDTRINLHELDNVFKSFKRLYGSLAQLQPKLTKKGLKSVLRESLFHRYLDPNKADHYQDVKDFWDSAQKLKKYADCLDIHLMRYAIQGLWIEKGHVEINHSVFAE